MYFLRRDLNSEKLFTEASLIVEKVFEKMLPLMKEYLDTEVGKINKKLSSLKRKIMN